MARPRNHWPAQRNRFQTNIGIKTCRCFRVRDARCGSVHWEGSVPRYDEWFGYHTGRQREKACQTAGRRAAWPYYRDVEVHREMLVCRPQQATDRGRSSQDLGTIRQRVCYSPFPVTPTSQHIASRPGTPTPALKAWERQSRSSPRYMVSHPGLRALAAVLIVGKQSSRHISRGFVVSRSSLPPRRTGSRSRSLPLIRRRRFSRSLLAMTRLKPARAVTPHHVAPRNRCFRRSAQSPSSRPEAPIHSGLSHAIRVSSVNSDREGSEGLQTCPLELSRYSLRVRLLRYHSVRLTHLRAQTRERAYAASTLSSKALLTSITAAIGIYHLFTWRGVICPCFLGFLAGFLTQTDEHVEYFRLIQRGIRNICNGRF